MFFTRIREDLIFARQHDPAGRGHIENALVYPGLHALWIYRIAHKTWNMGFRGSARVISYCARMLTGVDIHPAARIGRRVFIDHGMGTVIGETVIIGDDVVIYHGVTLGGISLPPEGLSQGLSPGLAPVRRHPRIENNVHIGAGAKILGCITVSQGARIGAGAVVTKNVPPYCVATGIPATIRPRKNTK